jgi:hypothetical protein
MNQFMFDTCVFNHMLDQDIDLNAIRSQGRFFVTHIQRDEINNCSNESRKNQLLELFFELQDEKAATESTVLGISRLGESKLSGNSVPTSSAVWGVSRWGEAQWTDPKASFYETIKSDLDRIKNKPNNIQDALIGETALKNKFTLVTDDKALAEVMKKYGCRVITLMEFMGS